MNEGIVPPQTIEKFVIISSEHSIVCMSPSVCTSSASVLVITHVCSSKLPFFKPAFDSVDCTQQMRMEMPLMAGLNQRDKYWRTITQRLEINNKLDDS